VSEGVAIGIGLAIGFVMVGAVLLIKRDEVARSMRLYRSGQSDASVGSPSSGAMAFGSFGGVVSINAGLLLGEWLPVVAGAVLIAAVVMQLVMARRAGHRQG